MSLINIQKHGLDAKRSSSDEFLEIKQVSFQSKTWRAIFKLPHKQKSQISLVFGMNATNLEYNIPIHLYLAQEVRKVTPLEI